MPERIYLSPPHMSGQEIELVQQAFADNWIAPVGPHLTAFESEMSAYVGVRHAVALSSGTAAVHLGLQLLGIRAGDHVIVSDLTFIGSANPIKYLQANPIFIDSESNSWNMDPHLLETFLRKRAAQNQLPKAIIIVHLYGQCANMDAIIEICDRYELSILEDAAEALGSRYKTQYAGSLGKLGIFSFNGNKIITTSGGGMLVSDDEALVARARYLATQAREPAPHYEHNQVGYNYRMSNILAAIGRGQLRILPERIERKQQIFRYYYERLGELPGIAFMPETNWGRHTRWLSVMTIEPDLFGADREVVRLALEAENIEARPIWKPMHLQPIFQNCEFIGSGVSEGLFKNGLCLPSGTALTEDALDRIVSIIADQHC